MTFLLKSAKSSSFEASSTECHNQIATEQKRYLAQARDKKNLPYFQRSLLSLLLLIGLLGSIWHSSIDGLENSTQAASKITSLYGPDRSGLYGGAQGIGGLEAEYDQQGGGTHGIVNNFFGDVLGLVGSGNFIPYNSVLGGYGIMPGSEKVSTPLQPRWRSRCLDETGFVWMGARYYEPTSGRFISADPLGHNASLSLYDYCDGDPVNGLDPDGRCPGKIAAVGSILASALFGGPGAYAGVNYGTDRLGITDTSSLTDEQQFQYNSQVANLTEATQEITFTLAGAVTPVNRVSYEPMRFEVGAGEPAIKPIIPNKTGQMEFRFARGAGVQTPDITKAGEVFVRVGATEESTVARPGSYVMPATTFNFFRRAPNMLKDAFDLPGSEPKYYRYIFPPAGTSIQRGIVPGKEFGGNGGYNESILWY